MKVLIAGESSVHLQNYCRAIKKHVDEIIIITETSIQVPEAKRSYIISFREMNPFQWYFSYKKLKKIIQEEKPDLVHVHQINRLAYFIARSLINTPLIATAWGSDVLLVPQRSFTHRMFSTFVIKKSRFVTADSQSMIEAMKAMVNTDSKYFHLQYGIDPITPAIKEKIIYSNRLHNPLYNIDTIIKDFASFSFNHPDWKLHIAGKGSDTEKLIALATQLKVSDKVKFLGWMNKEQNAEQYSKAAIYVSIPSSDGTSVSLLEAMSAECIPVVSYLPSNGEWIENGINGVIKKEKKNPFEEALTLNSKRCGEINRKKIDLLAVRENTTKTFFSLYKKVIGA